MGNTFLCAWVQNCTHRRSSPCLLVDYPIRLRFTHESTLLMPLQFLLLVVCTYAVAFSRHRNWKSKQGKECSAITLTSFQHNPPAFLCLLSCSDRFKHLTCSCCCSMSISFHPSPLIISRKEKNPGAPPFVFGDHSRMLGKMKHCFDLMKLGVLLETFVS